MKPMDELVLLLSSFLTGRSAMTKVVPRNKKKKTIKEVLTETGETRRQFDKDFLSFLKEQTEELAKKPPKSEVLEATLAVCHHLKKGNGLIELNPALVEAVEKFQEFYHLLYTSLPEAVEAETTDALRILIKNHVDLNKKYRADGLEGKEERTALYDAVSAGNDPKVEHVRLLLDSGADPYQCLERRIKYMGELTDYKVSPLGCAVDAYNPEMLKVMLVFGVNINHEHPYRAGETYFTRQLSSASSRDRNEVPYDRERFIAKIKLMIDYNANVNHVNPDWTTPLMHAAVLGDENLIKEFLDKQANQTIRNVDASGRNVLCYAGSVGVAKLLLAAGAEMDKEMLQKYAQMPWKDSKLMAVYHNDINIQIMKLTSKPGPSHKTAHKQNKASGSVLMFSENLKNTPLPADSPNQLLEFLKLSRGDLRGGK